MFLLFGGLLVCGTYLAYFRARSILLDGSSIKYQNVECLELVFLQPVTPAYDC